MKKILFILTILLITACSNIQKSVPSEDLSGLQSSIIVQWHNVEVNQVKINGKVIERGREYEVPVGIYKVKWTIVSESKQFNLKSYNDQGQGEKLEHNREYWYEEKVEVFGDKNEFTIEKNKITRGIDQKF